MERPTCGTNGIDVMQEDMAALLRALNMGDHARPVSCHKVMLHEIIPEVIRLVALERTLLENA